MSQDDVAAAIGVSRTTFAHWETGERRPDQSDIRKLVALYDADPVLIDEWVEEQIENRVAKALGSRKGPRAMDPRAIEKIRWIIRLAWGQPGGDVASSAPLRPKKERAG
jgi:transcriptional regulator with XRE-family HTH domain